MECSPIHISYQPAVLDLYLAAFVVLMHSLASYKAFGSLLGHMINAVKSVIFLLGLTVIAGCCVLHEYV
jgi:hypothetical protein